MSYESLIVDASLVSYHLLQETTGTTAADASGHGKHGVYTGMGASPVSVAGPTAWLPRAVTFDGSNDYVEHDGEVASFTNWTVGCWFRTTATAGDRWMVAEGSSSNTLPFIGIAVISGKIRCSYRTDTGDSTQVNPAPTANDGLWHFVQLARDGSTFNTYMDGSLIGSTVKAMATATTDISTIGILKRSSTSNQFQGELAGAIKFSRALTLSEHQALFAGPAAGGSSNIAALRRRAAARRKYRL